MRYFLYSLVALLFLITDAQAACNVPICREQGGARITIGSGGSLDVESSGEIDIESGGALKVAGTDITSELVTLGGSTAGTVVASKVVTVDSNKDIGDFRNLDATNFDAGLDATAGTIDIFPATTASGTLRLSATDSSREVRVTITNADHGQATVMSIPDGGQATANFVISEGVATIAGVKTFSSALVTGAEVGTVSGTGITVVERGSGIFHETIFTITAHALTVTDSGANGGHGSQKIYDFPEGHIKVISGHANVTVFSAQGTAAADSGVFDIALGTTATATDNEELATTEQDIVTKIEGTLDGSGDLSSAVSNIDSTDETFDGSTTAIDLFLNAAITAATISATEVFDVTAVVTVYWVNAGDD